MDESTVPAVLAELGHELADLLAWLGQTPDLDVGTAETTTLARLRPVGSRLLETGLAARGDQAECVCVCGSQRHRERRRANGVQTLLGWITIARTSARWPACGTTPCPADAALGVHRDRHRPVVRRLASRCGALLSFTQAATTLQEAAGGQRSASTVRIVTDAVGQARADHRGRNRRGLGPRLGRSGRPATRSLLRRAGWRAHPGHRWRGPRGHAGPGHAGPPDRPGRAARAEPRRRRAGAGRRLRAAAGGGCPCRRRRDGTPARGARQPGFWTLADAHVPRAVQIVDWDHASERIWDLGRAVDGAATPETATWVADHLARLAAGEAATLATAWTRLPCRGEAATVRDAQVTSFTNQAGRMASAQYRAAGWDIGSGMIERGGKTIIGQRGDALE